MGKTFTQTLNSSGAFISIQYKIKSVYSMTFLQQGGISSYNDGNYVGVMRFTSMPNCKTLAVKSIKFSFTFESNDYNKNLTFYGCSLLVGKDDNKTGGDYLSGNQLGTVTVDPGKTKEITLSKTSNSTLFSNLNNYLKSASKVENICLYDSTATRLFKITSVTITIEYDEGLVYYGVNNKWQPCLVYYGVNGQWQQVIPHYGINNEWKILGGG